MFLRKFLEPREETKPKFFERMKQAIGATKNNLVARIENALSGRTVIDDNLLDELEGILLGADLGIKRPQKSSTRSEGNVTNSWSRRRRTSGLQYENSC